MSAHTAETCSGGGEAHDAHMTLNDECPWPEKRVPTTAADDMRDHLIESIDTAIAVYAPVAALRVVEGLLIDLEARADSLRREARR